MGPNGSGKSTLAQVLAGRTDYTVKQGSVTFDGADLLCQNAEQRARNGLFLAFQYPVEIPGVNNAYFLKAALNAKRKHQGLEELDAIDFLAQVKSTMKSLEMDPRFLERPVNEGFSGGEKKRNEVLQMAVLQPKLAIFGRNRLGSRYRRLAHRGAGGEPLCAALSALWWLLPIISACSTTSCRISCMCWRRGKSSSRATSRWRCSWKTVAMPGSIRASRKRKSQEPAK